MYKTSPTTKPQIPRSLRLKFSIFHRIYESVNQIAVGVKKRWILKRFNFIRDRIVVRVERNRDALKFFPNISHFIPQHQLKLKWSSHVAAIQISTLRRLSLWRGTCCWFCIAQKTLLSIRKWIDAAIRNAARHQHFACSFSFSLHLNNSVWKQFKLQHRQSTNEISEDWMRTNFADCGRNS